MNLIKLVGTWKEGSKRENLEENASDAPVIHLVIVVAIGEKTLWRSVPSGRDILCEGRLRVDTSAGSKVCKLNHIARNQNILRLDISVINAVSVHMVYRLEDLVHHLLDSRLWERRPFSFDGFIHVHLHQLEY